MLVSLRFPTHTLTKRSPGAASSQYQSGPEEYRVRLWRSQTQSHVQSLMSQAGALTRRPQQPLHIYFSTYYSRFFRFALTPSPVAPTALPRPLAAPRSFPLFGLVALESGVSCMIAVSFAVTFWSSFIALTGLFSCSNDLVVCRQGQGFHCVHSSFRVFAPLPVPAHLKQDWSPGCLSGLRSVSPTDRVEGPLAPVSSAGSLSSFPDRIRCGTIRTRRTRSVGSKRFPTAWRF